MRRTIVIPDIHGCCRTFQHLLQKVGLKKKDTVYLLGDYIDRGPDSRGVIDEIIARQAEGYDMRPLLGNHEDLLLKCLDSGEEGDLWQWLDSGGETTLKSYGVRNPEDIDPNHIEAMRTLPLYHLTETHIFVHAGLNFCFKDPLSQKGRESMLWQRSAVVDRRKIGGRKVVSGHTIQQIDQIIGSIPTSHIRLDNGCFTAGMYAGMGSLVALELETGVLHVQEHRG